MFCYGRRSGAEEAFGMIILRIRDNAGPGNQMFMYAFAYALARNNAHKIWIISEISYYSIRQNVLQSFTLDRKLVKGFLRLSGIRHVFLYRVIRKLIFDVFLKLPFFHWIVQPAEESRRMLPLEKLKKGSVYVADGYWECHAYFNKYRADLIRQFSPLGAKIGIQHTLSEKLSKDKQYGMQHTLSEGFTQDEYFREAEEITAVIRRCESVAVHIRKGDFAAFGRLIEDAYYDQAIQRFREELVQPVFFILSEDDEVKERYRNIPDCRILDLHTPDKYMDEWYALMQCRHHIIANSTYSFWSAYLSDHPEKQIIIPTLSQYLSAEPEGDPAMYLNYYPEHWRKASVSENAGRMASASEKAGRKASVSEKEGHQAPVLEKTDGCGSTAGTGSQTAFVILNYCSMRDTKACAASVKSCAFGCPIVIVDNASDDGSGRLLEREYSGDPVVTVILNHKNQGYSRGNNIGIRYARTRLHAEFIIVLNPDTRMIQRDFTARIREEYEHSKFAVLGPMVLDRSGNNDSSPIRTGDTDDKEELRRIYVSWRRQYLKALTGFSSVHLHIRKNDAENAAEDAADIKHNAGKGQKKNVIPQRQVNVLLHGCCLVFSPEYFRYFAGFEERTFMYGEETILKMNCLRTGLLLVYQPELRIIHMEAAKEEQKYLSGQKRIQYARRMKNAAKAIYRKSGSES